MHFTSTCAVENVFLFHFRFDSTRASIHIKGDSRETNFYSVYSPSLAAGIISYYFAPNMNKFHRKAITKRIRRATERNVRSTKRFYAN